MNKRKNNGITLIALVITIIVLLILAGISVSLFLSQDGIISKAIDAKNNTDISGVLEQIKLEIMASYNNDGKLRPEDVKLNILNNVKDVNDIEGTEFPLIIRTNKKAYILKGNGELVEKHWIKKNDGTITDGVVTLNIGDYVSYDHTKDKNGDLITGNKAIYTSYSESNASLNSGITNGSANNFQFTLNGYTGGWKILDVEEGKLKLISENSVGNLSLKGQNGYIYGEDELNAISSIYGNGKGAEFARSVNVTDINKITGYNPKKTGTGEVRAKGKMWEYGNKVTYFWQNGKIKCIATNGLTYASNYTVFKYYDKVNEEFIDLANNDNIELISSSYNYYPKTLTESSSGITNGIENTSKEYKLLFNFKYWLASKFIGTGQGNVGFGIFQLDTNRIYDSNLYESINSSNTLTYGVRPVIILYNEINLIKNEENDGTTKLKGYIID